MEHSVIARSLVFFLRSQINNETAIISRNIRGRPTPAPIATVATLLFEKAAGEELGEVRDVVVELATPKLEFCVVESSRVPGAMVKIDDEQS